MKSPLLVIPALAILAIGLAATPALATEKTADGMIRWCMKRPHCKYHSAFDHWIEVFDNGHWWSCPPEGLCIQVYRQSQIDNSLPLGGLATTGFDHGHGSGDGSGDGGGSGGSGGGIVHTGPVVTGLVNSTGPGNSGAVIQ